LLRSLRAALRPRCGRGVWGPRAAPSKTERSTEHRAPRTDRTQVFQPGSRCSVLRVPAFLVGGGRGCRFGWCGWGGWLSLRLPVLLQTLVQLGDFEREAMNFLPCRVIDALQQSLHRRLEAF